MKLSLGIRDVLVKKLSESLATKLSDVDFNEAFLFLDRCDKMYKILPYGLFENSEYLEKLTETNAGIVFGKWLDKTTRKISTPFNKGRKLVRQFKEIETNYQDSLAFNLSATDIFVVSLTSLFVGYAPTALPFKFPTVDEESVNRTLDILREYLAVIFFIDMVDDDLLIEGIVRLFVNGELDSLIRETMELGLLYKDDQVL
jgi:hypothetical protein